MTTHHATLTTQATFTNATGDKAQAPAGTEVRIVGITKHTNEGMAMLLWINRGVHMSAVVDPSTLVK